MLSTLRFLPQQRVLHSHFSSRVTKRIISNINYCTNNTFTVNEMGRNVEKKIIDSYRYFYSRLISLSLPSIL